MRPWPGSGDNPRWYQRVVSHLSRVVSAKCLCCKLVNDEGIPNDPITAVVDADCSLDVRFLKFLAETLHQIKLQHVGYQAVDTTSPPTISITLIYDFEPKMFHEMGGTFSTKSDLLQAFSCNFERS